MLARLLLGTAAAARAGAAAGLLDDAAALVQLAAPRGRKPSEPGCYVRMPSGCPVQEAKQPTLSLAKAYHQAAMWKRDNWAETNIEAAYSKKNCVGKRSRALKEMCGVDDVEMLFVPGITPPAPSVPGCYVFHPTGCNGHAPTAWKLAKQTDRWQLDGDLCEVEAKEYWNQQCGTADAHALFVRAMPPVPKSPGCYVWLHGGACPRQPAEIMKSYSGWVLDKAGGGGPSAAACDARGAHFDAWCGAAVSRMMFVPKFEMPGAAPSKFEMPGAALSFAKESKAPQAQTIERRGIAEEEGPPEEDPP